LLANSQTNNETSKIKKNTGVFTDLIDWVWSGGVERSILKKESEKETEKAFNLYMSLFFGRSNVKVAVNLYSKIKRKLKDNPYVIEGRVPFPVIQIRGTKKSAPVPKGIKSYLDEQKKSADRTLQLLNFTSNEGAWRKVLGLAKSTKDQAATVELKEKIWAQFLEDYFTEEVRSFLIGLDFKNNPGSTAELFSEIVIKKIEPILKKFMVDVLQPNKINTNKLQQTVVRLVHGKGFKNLDLKNLLEKNDGFRALEAVTLSLQIRDAFAEALGYENHFDQFESAWNNESTLQFRGKRVNEKISKWQDEINSAATLEQTGDWFFVRAASLTEAPYRSRIGADECSSRSYALRVLDPNFYVFTKSELNGMSDRHISVVLGEASSKKVAFIDKIQNIPDHELTVMIEAVRVSVLSKGYELILPEDKGNHNGISNSLGTRMALNSDIEVAIDNPYLNFTPFDTKFEYKIKHSRAFSGLKSHKVLPAKIELSINNQGGQTPIKTLDIKNWFQSLEKLNPRDFLDDSWVGIEKYIDWHLVARKINNGEYLKLIEDPSFKDEIVLLVLKQDIPPALRKKIFKLIDGKKQLGAMIWELILSRTNELEESIWIDYFLSKNEKEIRTHFLENSDAIITKYPDKTNIISKILARLEDKDSEILVLYIFKILKNQPTLNDFLQALSTEKLEHVFKYLVTNKELIDLTVNNPFVLLAIKILDSADLSINKSGENDSSVLLLESLILNSPWEVHSLAYEALKAAFVRLEFTTGKYGRSYNKLYNHEGLNKLGASIQKSFYTIYFETKRVDAKQAIIAKEEDGAHSLYFIYNQYLVRCSELNITPKKFPIDLIIFVLSKHRLINGKWIYENILLTASKDLDGKLKEFFEGSKGQIAATNLFKYISSDIVQRTKSKRLLSYYYIVVKNTLKSYKVLKNTLKSEGYLFDCINSLIEIAFLYPDQKNKVFDIFYELIFTHKEDSTGLTRDFFVDLFDNEVSEVTVGRKIHKIRERFKAPGKSDLTVESAKAYSIYLAAMALKSKKYKFFISELDGLEMSQESILHELRYSYKILDKEYDYSSFKVSSVLPIPHAFSIWKKASQALSSSKENHGAEDLQVLILNKISEHLLGEQEQSQSRLKFNPKDIFDPRDSNDKKRINALYAIASAKLLVALFRSKKVTEDVDNIDLLFSKISGAVFDSLDGYMPESGRKIFDGNWDFNLYDKTWARVVSSLLIIYNAEFLENKQRKIPFTDESYKRYIFLSRNFNNIYFYNYEVSSKHVIEGGRTVLKEKYYSVKKPWLDIR